MLSIVMGKATDNATLVVIVLERSNMDRMEAGDPAELPLITLPIPGEVKASEVTVMVCYEDEMEKVLELQKGPDGRQLLAYLCRGWSNQKGDGDKPKRLTSLQ